MSPLVQKNVYVSGYQPLYLLFPLTRIVQKRYAVISLKVKQWNIVYVLKSNKNVFYKNITKAKEYVQARGGSRIWQWGGGGCKILSVAHKSVADPGFEVTGGPLF